jgi:hypothetical protein
MNGCVLSAVPSGKPRFKYISVSASIVLGQLPIDHWHGINIQPALYGKHAAGCVSIKEYMDVTARLTTEPRQTT